MLVLLVQGIPDNLGPYHHDFESQIASAPFDMELLDNVILEKSWEILLRRIDELSVH
jgi:hypothetical protein